MRNTCNTHLITYRFPDNAWSLSTQSIVRIIKQKQKINLTSFCSILCEFLKHPPDTIREGTQENGNGYKKYELRQKKMRQGKFWRRKLKMPSLYRLSVSRHGAEIWKWCYQTRVLEKDEALVSMSTICAAFPLLFNVICVCSFLVDDPPVSVYTVWTTVYHCRFSPSSLINVTSTYSFMNPYSFISSCSTFVFLLFLCWRRQKLKKKNGVNHSGDFISLQL